MLPPDIYSEHWTNYIVALRRTVQKNKDKEKFSTVMEEEQRIFMPLASEEGKIIVSNQVIKQEESDN